ncbi:hypothetical protein IB60_16995 [Brucella abortus LMN1]|uniref:hypothetical protein n=1 Tax=Brucella abortus TaxID=235 RepID=UPI0004E952E1|nr:hypothetical protein [Brucella abortus]KFH18408.1 hypothetical protein IB60_16995 [Brucella abortus LMN1]
MQVSITFDPSDEKDVAAASAAIASLTGASAPAAPAKTDAKKADAKKEEKAKEPEKPKEEEKPASKHSREDVRAKLKEYAALEGKDAAIKILKDNGAASITELEEDKFDAVMEACGD